MSGVAGTLLVAPLPSTAAEPVSNAANEPETAAPVASGAVAANVTAVFATRWGEPAQDFSLGVDGNIRRSAFSAIKQEPAGRARRQAEPLALSKESQNSSLSSAPLTGQCGPSPADPAEIKQLITQAARRHQVDPEFALAIAFAESRFDRLRNSPKGARGPMQLIPATAARFGVDDICDPVSNIDGGLAYLRQLFDEFRNPLLVAAAYNAGENRIRERGGIPPIAETLGFVAEVVNYQLGIAPANEPDGPSTKERDLTKRGNAKMSSEAGLTSSTTRRQWIGGVMQF
jgi:soluble lytic murein transglycosylase-like protein